MMPDAPPTPPKLPVTLECVLKAAKTYQVPAVVLVGVMAQEGGTIGQIKVNSNNTGDHGPMQINSVWLSDLNKRGITAQQVANNGCLNVNIGAAILNKHAKNTHGNWLKAIGIYHSKTPDKRDNYLLKVSGKIMQLISKQITLASILEKANKG